MTPVPAATAMMCAEVRTVLAEAMLASMLFSVGSPALLTFPFHSSGSRRSG